MINKDKNNNIALGSQIPERLNHMKSVTLAIILCIEHVVDSKLLYPVIASCRFGSYITIPQTNKTNQEGGRDVSSRIKD